MADPRSRSATTGTTYDVVGRASLTFAELLRTAADTGGSRARFVPEPLTSAAAAGRCYERLGCHSRIRAEQLQRLAEDKAFAIYDAARNFGYAPRSVTDSILAEARALRLAR